MNNKLKKGFKITGTVVFYAFIAILLLFSVANIRQTDKAKDYPNIFGRGFLQVESDSMTGKNDDSFVIGDLIVVKKATTKRINKLEVGDIITFYDYKAQDDVNRKSFLNSHRIVEVRTTNSGKVFITQGDKAVESGLVYNPNDQLYNVTIERYFDVVSDTQVKGIYVSKVEGFGNVVNHISNNFFWYVVLPILLFLVFEVFVVVKNVLDLRDEKNKANNKVNEDALRESIKAELEAEKEKMRQELLAEMNKKDNKE